MTKLLLAAATLVATAAAASAQFRPTPFPMSPGPGAQLRYNPTLTRLPNGAFVTNTPLYRGVSTPFGYSGAFNNTSRMINPFGVNAVAYNNAYLNTGPGWYNSSANRSGLATDPFGGFSAYNSASRSAGNPFASASQSATRSLTADPFGNFSSYADNLAAASNPYGSISAANRAATNVSPFGVTSSAYRRVDAADPFAATSEVQRVGYSASPFGYSFRAGTASNYADAFVNVSQGETFRANNLGWFGRAWYNERPGLWRPTSWATPDYWTAPTWGAVSTYVGLPAGTFFDWNFGNNVVFDNGRVFSGGNDIGAVNAFAARALGIADVGRTAALRRTEGFRPLGVFALMQEGDRRPQNVFQLAISQTGVVRGNYYNAVTDKAETIYGSLDRKTQRVAWIIGDRRDVVYEAGLGNLMQQVAPAVVHYGRERSAQASLVRQDRPER